MPILDLLDSGKYVSKELKAARVAICLECPAYLRMTKRCNECGCFIYLKAALNTEGCPRKKW